VKLPEWVRPAATVVSPCSRFKGIEAEGIVAQTLVPAAPRLVSAHSRVARQIQDQGGPFDAAASRLPVCGPVPGVSTLFGVASFPVGQQPVRSRLPPPHARRCQNGALIQRVSPR
jgi:hypothetical protein